MLYCVLAPPNSLSGRPLDVTVAATPLQPGDVALSIPEELVVTLDRIFECENLGESLEVLGDVSKV